MTSTNSREAAELRSLWLALVVFVIVFALKIAVYFVSGLMALLAEAMHTLSDVFISGFLLAAVFIARRQADERYRFGYRRAQNVAALVAATLFISFTSYELYRQAIPRLLDPSPSAYENLPLAVGVLLASMVIAAAPLVRLLKQSTRGAAAKAQLMGLLNDELGLLAALIATIFIAAGMPLADPIAAIVIATVIAYNAVGLFRENSSMLVGRAPPPEVLQRMQASALAVPGVLGVREVRAEYVGPESVHADVHIEARPRMPIEEASRLGAEVARRVHETIEGGYCTVSVEPALRFASGDAP